MSQETDSKLAMLRAWLDRTGEPGVALSGSGSVAWLSGGITNPIDRSDPMSMLWLIVTPAEAVAVTTAVERPRLEAEGGLEELGFTLEDVPWYEPTAFQRAAERITGTSWSELVPDEDELIAMRLTLLPEERERMARLGQDAARALEETVRTWRPGERDLDVQARLVERLERVGALPVCVIVGGDERVERYRHPLATGAPVDWLLMAVIVAQRDGLHVAATRFASAGEVSDSVRSATDGALDIEAAMLGACRAGATYGDVLRVCEEAYAAVGHPGAWQEHYQGGPVGYRQREFELAPPQSESRWYSQPIEAGQAVAWNPSIAGGGKIEDTFLVEEDGLRCLTETGDWPAIETRGERPRTGILEIAR